MIQAGSKVSIHYKLTVDGELVDTSEGQDPLAYVQGSGEIIPGLEEELTGLKVGDKKSVSIPPEKGYGPYESEAVQQVPISAFNEADKLKAGDIVSGEMQGQTFRATVVTIDKESVRLDLNHPLAGKTLEFHVEVIGIE